MAIRVPGTEEGDRSSRYPEDDGDNPNTRGQRTAIIQVGTRERTAAIQIPGDRGRRYSTERCLQISGFRT